MADILQDLWIGVPRDRVFRACSDPQGLDAWWTQSSSGTPVAGAEYTLAFGPGYTWKAVVSRVVPGREFELSMTEADADWVQTRVGIRLDDTADGAGTHVHFHHTGWPDANAHFRVSNHCWAMYLRLLRRYLEHGELVPYDDRLTV